jgi:hypothetical protein
LGVFIIWAMTPFIAYFGMQCIKSEHVVRLSLCRHQIFVKFSDISPVLDLNDDSHLIESSVNRHFLSNFEEMFPGKCHLIQVPKHFCAIWALWDKSFTVGSCSWNQILFTEVVIQHVSFFPMTQNRADVRNFLPYHNSRRLVKFWTNPHKSDRFKARQVFK